ncbi:MAG TPA: cytochrome c3 family protein [Fimbriimonadales bacterium]|nr:cytochrome c3 family protein [Fimbriimonadales bacterium]
MPQIFPESANVLAKASLPGAGLLLIAVILVGANITPYTHDLNVALDQPAPFSHMHHVDQLGIDCRYCHTTVEESPFAGIPATETCYTCHSQIWTNSPLLQVVRDSYATGQPMEWNRVNIVPDFVFFDHSIHIKKGISCVSCHGNIDKMNLTAKQNAFQMLFCLDCHRNPEKNLRPLSEVFNMKYQPPPNHEALAKELMEKYGIEKTGLTDCWVCHR